MFLNVLRRRNPELISAAVALHQAGQIPANSYVLDLDTVEANARLIADEAARQGLRVLAMTKQIGRCPAAMDAIVAGGIGSFVAVDVGCAEAIHRAERPVTHIGHLVQIPQRATGRAAALRPEYWTVFTERKAAAAGHAARTAGRSQRVLARIIDPDDRFYTGHEGGFPAADVERVASMLDGIDGISFAGVTTFPALLFDEPSGRVEATPNLRTIERAAERLSNGAGRTVEVNAPGTTSADVLNVLADAGATQVEPGHGLTGTTPLHAIRDLPERPALVYVSEISHHHGGMAYFFGGGLYIDPVVAPYPVRALVGGGDLTRLREAGVDMPAYEAIDYYGRLETDGGPPSEGASVVLGFRPQVFVTRAHVAAVAGISSSNPRVRGIYTRDGLPVDW